MTAPPVLSILGEADRPPDVLRRFLERLVASAANRQGLVVGEAEPGRYVLVTPPVPPATMRDEIDAGLDLVLAKLGESWPNPHVTDLGLRELYERAREPWLASYGLDALVREGKMGVVTIFCHDWVYDVCTRVAADHGLRVPTSFEEYARAGKVRVEGRNAFQVDVFANLQEMGANFDPIDHLVAKVLVLAGLSGDETLAERARREG